MSEIHARHEHRSQHKYNSGRNQLIPQRVDNSYIDYNYHHHSHKSTEKVAQVAVGTVLVSALFVAIVLL